MNTGPIQSSQAFRGAMKIHVYHLLRGYHTVKWAEVIKDLRCGCFYSSFYRIDNGSFQENSVTPVIQYICMCYSSVCLKWKLIRMENKSWTVYIIDGIISSTPHIHSKSVRIEFQECSDNVWNRIVPSNV